VRGDAGSEVGVSESVRKFQELKTEGQRSKTSSA